MALSESRVSRIFQRIGNRIIRIQYRLMEYTTVRFIAALSRKIGQDDISNTAASISFYAFLSLFPLVLSLLAISGIWLPSASVQQQLINLFSHYLPGSLVILENNIPDIIRFRATFGIIGILGLLWSGTSVFSAIARGMNKAWDIQQPPPFYLRKPLELGMILGSGILLFLSLCASTLLSFLINLNLPISGTLINIGTAAAGFVFSLIVIGLINKLTPLARAHWRYIWPGTIFSTILFEIAKTFFIFYVNNYNHYDKIYGSIASVIILLIWIYYSAFILLLGAELNSMLQRVKKEGIQVLTEAN